MVRRATVIHVDSEILTGRTVCFSRMGDTRFAATGIKMNIFWRLQGLSGLPEQWQLYAGYTPLFVQNALKQRFQGAEWQLALPDTPGLLGRLVGLVEEIRPRLPERPDLKEGSLTFKVEGELRHLVRWPMSSLEHMPQTDIVWSRPNVIAGTEIGGDKGHVEVSGLSEASRSAIWDVDGHTVAACYRHLQAALDAATDIPADMRLPPRRIKVFVAYRKPHQKIAEAAHALLSASHVIFDPYMDRHDLELGDWKEQLFKAIEQADVFMPIVTADYGEDGTVCREEYELAKRIAAERAIDNFIAPIFIDAHGDVGAEIENLQGLMARDPSKLDEQPRWGIFERQVIGAGVRSFA